MLACYLHCYEICIVRINFTHNEITEKYISISNASHG